MDAWDSEFTEPSEDEKSARRVLSLALGFINSRTPLSMSYIHTEYYASTSVNTFRKTFLRDRERLALTGLVLQRGPIVEGQPTWEVNKEASFVGQNPLDQSDALLLDFLLLPLAADASFPYARDLRLALAKIDRSFDSTSVAAIPPSARKRNNALSRLEDCMSAGHAAYMQYRRADGSHAYYNIAPYGFFFLNETTYMVAAALIDNMPQEPHTYNLNRVGTVRPLARLTYTLPEDFDVRDFIRLPFQMGPGRYTAVFEDESGQTVQHEVFDEHMAASWAIAGGLKPLSPPSLVEAYRAILLNVSGKDAHV